MDLVTIWTALGVISVVAGGIITAVRNADATRIRAVESKLDKLERDTTEKAHKDEIARIETRFERDIADLRADQKNGFAEIRQDLKDFRNDMIALFSSK
jgi:outer membrane murein-binding lipoprotein Lpp